MNVDAAAETEIWFWWDGDAYLGPSNPYVAECIALREGMEMEVARGLVNSYAETDAVNVVQAANSSCSILKMLWPIIDDIKACFSKVAGGIICCHVNIFNFSFF